MSVEKCKTIEIAAVDIITLIAGVKSDIMKAMKLQEQALHKRIALSGQLELLEQLLKDGELPVERGNKK